MRLFRHSLAAICVPTLALFAATLCAQVASRDQLPPPPHAKQIHLKHVLVIGQTKGFEHDSVSAAMAAIYNMGQESGLWDTDAAHRHRTAHQEGPGQSNAKNLNYFDVLVFCQHHRRTRYG